MSELVVGSIAGLASNSYVVDVASGSTLDITNATGTVPSGVLPAGSVIQVVSVTYSTEVAINSTSYADTGLSASITPSSVNSKILVITNQQGSMFESSTDTYTETQVRLVRDATPIYVTRTNILSRASSSSEWFAFSGDLMFLDSPATTSSVTYKTQGVNNTQASSGGIHYFQRQGIGNSTITLIEVAG